MGIFGEESACGGVVVSGSQVVVACFDVELLVAVAELHLA